MDRSESSEQHVKRSPIDAQPDPALYDGVTNLPSRGLFLDRLQQSIMASQRASTPCSLLIVDIDRFSDLTEDLGSDTGELLLWELAARLRNTLRESDTVARLSEAIFGVLLPTADEFGATLAARRLFEALQQPYDLQGQTVTVRCSVGMAPYVLHGRDATTLLQQAYTAMNEAKESGSGMAVFGVSEPRAKSKRQSLIDDLRQAIHYGELLLGYQPKVEIPTKIVVGVEALSYWEHPRHGFVPPDRFIPIAEHSGLIKQLTMWVLNEALRQQRVWADTGLDIPISVNISARNLDDPQLVGMVEQALSACGVQPSKLQLEIMETAIMADLERASRLVSQLGELGVQVSIDDFGTSYSSLTYLAQLGASELKIDRSFVVDMTVNEQDARIVRTGIDLGHNFQYRVVAEGVETEAAWNALAELGCDLAQGYYISAPLPPNDVLLWVKQSAPGVGR